MKRNVENPGTPKGGRHQEIEDPQDDELDMIQNESDKLVGQPSIEIGNSIICSLQNKLVMALIAVLSLFFLTNYFRKQYSYYGHSPIPAVAPVICKGNNFLFLNECINQCPLDFIGDSSDQTCKHKSIDPSQVHWVNDIETGRQMRITTRPSHASRVTTGIVFFNDYKNYDVSYLLHYLDSKVLQEFLEQADASVFTFTGADQFYFEAEERIGQAVEKLRSENPHIKRWLACGVGLSGGFNALKFQLRMPNLFTASFLADPTDSLDGIQDAAEIALTPDNLNLVKEFQQARGNSIQIYGFINKAVTSGATIFHILSGAFDVFTVNFYSKTFANAVQKTKIIMEFVFPMIQNYVNVQKKKEIINAE